MSAGSIPSLALSSLREQNAIRFLSLSNWQPFRFETAAKSHTVNSIFETARADLFPFASTTDVRIWMPCPTVAAEPNIESYKLWTSIDEPAAPR